MRIRASRSITAASALVLAVAAAVVSGIPASPARAAAAAPSTSAAATTDVAMPQGTVTSNGVTWKPVVAQDFGKPAATGQFAQVYGSAWAGYSGFADTSNRGVYAPANVLSVSNGNLNYFLHTANGRPQVAAPMPNGYTGQTYGRYAIRVRSDAVAGYKLAFLLWPTSNTWNDGEIDWPDGNASGKVYPASAIVGSYSPSAGMRFDAPSTQVAPTMGTGWHDAVIEWTKGHVRWYWDGRLIGQTTNAAGVPSKPMRWTLQAETSTDGRAVPASAQGKIQVAWVVQYKE